jgi:hypothetical protein
MDGNTVFFLGSIINNNANAIHFLANGKPTKVGHFKNAEILFPLGRAAYFCDAM